MTLWTRIGRTLIASPPTQPPGRVDEDTVRALQGRLDAAAQRRLGRSLAIRHIGAGGCNGCELELRATTNIVHDLARFGLSFVASPRHADILLVTGPLTRNMREALEHAWNATPDPKFVVALGDCAVDGGVFKGSYAILGGVDALIPVDLMIRGCPPAPEVIVTGLRALIEAHAR